MAVSEDRKFTKEQVYTLLEGAKGKTLGEVDKSHQFARTLESKKITGIAGDVIEQSVFGYKKDSKQECDIEIDGVLTEVKTTGVRVPKRDQKNAKGKTGEAYNVYLGAKEGISITHVTFEPPIQTDFDTSHFWAFWVFSSKFFPGIWYLIAVISKFIFIYIIKFSILCFNILHTTRSNPPYPDKKLPRRGKSTIGFSSCHH
jgi:hypothetical protein